MTSAPEGELLLPMFPLPNLVFFPRTRLPLHIFEPRYRTLITDVLAGDKRFGIVLLRPEWEADYFGAPPIHGCGTIGTIEQTVALDDGRFNILIHGDVRFDVIAEEPHEPYRVARVVARPQQEPPPEASYAQRAWLAELSQQYLHFLPEQAPVPEIQMVGLESLMNALVMSLNLDAAEKQRLLEMDDLIDRAESIGSELQNRIESLQFLAPFRRGGDPGKN